MEDVFLIIVAALANTQVVEIWWHGSLFAAWHTWLEEKAADLELLACIEENDRISKVLKWFNLKLLTILDLLLCPFCLSNWTAACLLLVLFRLTDRMEQAWLILPYAFAVARLSNLLNDATAAFTRTPGRGMRKELKGLHSDTGNSKEGDTATRTDAGRDA